MSGLGRQAARGAGVTMGAQGLRLVLQVGSLVVLSRLLTPAQVGLVAMVTALLNVAELIRDFGLSSAAIAARTLSVAERTNLFWLNVAIGTTCSVIAAASAPLLAWLYGEPEVLGIALALSGLFVVSGANTQYRADLSRSLRFRALAVTDVGAQVLSVTVAIAAAASGFGYWSIVLQQATFVVTSFVVNAMQCRWIPGRPRRDVSVRRFAKTGAHLLGTNLLGYAVNNLDSIGVGIVWGPGAAGLYTRVYQLLQVPLQQVNAPLTRVVLPVLSRLQDDRPQFDRFFARFQLAICYVLGVGFAILAGISDPLVGVLFGSTWSGAAPILAVLALSGVFKGIDSANYQLWVANGLTAKLFKFYLISRPLMVLAILAGLPWGALGVAYGQLVVAVLHWAIGLRYVCRRSGTDSRPLFAQSIRVMAFVVLPAGLASLAATKLPLSDLLQAGLGGVAGLVVAGVMSMSVPVVRRQLVPLIDVVARAMRRKSDPATA